MPNIGQTRKVSSWRFVPKMQLVERCVVEEVYIHQTSERGLHYGEWVAYDPEKHGPKQGRSRIPKGYNRATGK